MISRLRCIDPDDEPDERALARKRAGDYMRRRTETYAMHWQLLRAFMGRSVSVAHYHTGGVTIIFNTVTEAEQFHKLMTSAKGKGA